VCRESGGGGAAQPGAADRGVVRGFAVEVAASGAPASSVAARAEVCGEGGGVR
jgi:hypothetical protein